MPDIEELSQVLAMLQTLEEELSEVITASRELGYRWLAEELEAAQAKIADTTKGIAEIIGAT